MLRYTALTTRLLMLFVLFLALVGGSASQKVLIDDCKCAPNEVLIVLSPGNAGQLPNIAAQYNLIPTPLSEVGNPPTYRMQIDRSLTSMSPTQLIAAMQNDSRILNKETNRNLNLSEGHGLDWTLGQSWAIGDRGGRSGIYTGQAFPQQIRLNEAQAVASGQGVTIAVLDTGIDANHPAFAGRLVPGYDFVGNDADPSEEGSFRRNPAYGHGTHVAGIIALTAPNAKIMPIRVLDRDGVGNIWRIKDALIWAAQHGATIVNMSFGYPSDVIQQNNTFLQDLFHGCDDVNVPGERQFPEFNGARLLIVAGAGNGGQIGNGARQVFPAAERSQTDDNIISVGANTNQDTLAPFSTMADVIDRGTDRWVRVVAPGVNIVSAYPGRRYVFWSGTSMSTPIVSGIAALVQSSDPKLPLTEIVSRIEGTGYEWKCTVASRNITMETSRVDAFCAVTNNTACFPITRTICPE